MQTIRIQWKFCFKVVTDRNKRTPLGIASRVIKSSNLYGNCAEVIVLLYGINAACCLFGAGYLFSQHGHAGYFRIHAKKSIKPQCSRGRVIRRAGTELWNAALHNEFVFHFHALNNRLLNSDGVTCTSLKRFFFFLFPKIADVFFYTVHSAFILINPLILTIHEICVCLQAHASCYTVIPSECILGRLRNMILHPSCVRVCSRNFSKMHCYRISEPLQQCELGNQPGAVHQ